MSVPDKDHIRTAAICMIYNAEEYLCEFLLYHLALVDHIFLIDHKSRHDLRGLDLPGVTVVRSNHEAQFQSELTNLVVEHFDMRRRFDWVFPLDSDEFLPFTTQPDLQAFLKKHERSKVLRFEWRNGMPFYDPQTEHPESLIDCESIRFFHKHSMHVKSFPHLSRIGPNFVIGTGNHHIAYASQPIRSRIPVLKNRKIYDSTLSELPLFHIVAFNRDTFVRKIKNYVKQIGYRSHVKGQGGWVVQNYPSELSEDEWLWYVANFRVSDETRYEEAPPSTFVEVPVFGHLNVGDVLSLRRQVNELPLVEPPVQQEDELAYLKYKTNDAAVRANMEWFRIDDANEAQINVPGRGS